MKQTPVLRATARLFAVPGTAGFVRTLVLASLLALTAACDSGGAGVDEQGNPVAATFSKSFGGDGSDYGIAGGALTDGGYLVTGTLESPASDAFVGRLDANGNLVWQTAIGRRSLSSAAVGEIVAGPADGGGFCVGAGALGAEPQTRDALVARYDGNDALQWETIFDSGGWAGYDYAAIGSGTLGAAESAGNVIGDGDGGCYAVFVSTANLFDRSGIGFDGAEANVVAQDGGGSIRYGDTFVGARSYVVARVDAGGELLWLRRLVNGAFTSGEVNVRSTRPELVLTAQGVVAQYFFAREDGDRIEWHSVVAHYDRDGRSQFIVEHDAGDAVRRAVGPSRLVEIAQVDDPVDGVRDGIANDGFVIEYGATLLKLARNGQLSWQRELDRFASAGVFQQCFPERCLIVSIGNFDPDNTGLHPAVLYLAHDADSGDAVPETPAPDMVTVFGVRRFDADTVRVLGVTADGTTLLRHVNLLPLTSGGQPQYQVDPALTFTYPPGTYSGYELQHGTLRLSDTGLLNYRDGSVGIAAEAGSAHTVQIVGSGSLAEFVNDAATTTAGNHIVAGEAYGDSGGAFVAAVDDSGALLWQHLVSDAIVIGRVAARPAGGVVIVAHDISSSVRLIALSEDGELDWQTAPFDPVVTADDPIAGPGGYLPDFAEFQALVYGDILETTANGYLFGGLLRQAPGRGFSWLGEIDETGQTRWLRAYPFAPSSATVLADGRIELAAVVPSGFQVWTLDNAGVTVAADEYRLPAGTVTRSAGITDAGGGAVNVAMTTRYLIAGSTPSGNRSAIGEDNVAVVRLAADGNAEWARVHGGLATEKLSRSTAMADGGVLLSAQSQSLGVQSEMWTLRLGGNGRVTESCNAYLGEIAGAQIVRTGIPADSMALPLPGPGTGAAVTLSDAGFTSYVPNVVEARQCLGRSTANGTEPGGAPQRTLTVHQAGSIAGLATSTPAGLFCDGTATGVCSAGFAPDSLVTLAVDDSSTAEFRGWGDGCIEQLTNPQRCVTGLTADRDVDVFFEPADGSSATLTVRVTGNGRVITTDMPGIACHSDPSASDCAETYPLGQRVRLALDLASAEFQGWGDDCAEWARAGTIRVTVDRDLVCSAQFAGDGIPPSYRLDVAISVDGQPQTQAGTGGEVLSTPEGAGCGRSGDDCSGDFAGGTTVRLFARPGTGYVFDGWSSTDPASPCATATDDMVDVVMDRDRQCTARFVTPGSQVAILTTEVRVDGATPGPGDPSGGNIVSVPAGIDCGSQSADCTEGYPGGTQVVLTATADTGYRFSQFSGDCSGTVTSTSVAMAVDRHCVAEFVSAQPNTAVLTVAVNGGGRIDSNPAGIACGTDCTEDFPLNTSITLVASGTATTPFQNWDGDCSGGMNTTVLMSANRSCTANFVPTAGTFRLTIQVIGGGSILSADGGIGCPGDCIEDYPANTQVPITAVPDAGNHLQSWSGDCFDLGAATNFQLTMFADRNCTATFVP